jgi:hypothetical protein
MNAIERAENVQLPADIRRGRIAERKDFDLQN